MSRKREAKHTVVFSQAEPDEAPPVVVAAPAAAGPKVEMDARDLKSTWRAQGRATRVMRIRGLSRTDKDVAWLVDQYHLLGGTEV